MTAENKPIFAVPGIKDIDGTIWIALNWGSPEWRAKNPDQNAGRSFEDVYRKSPTLGSKYAVASVLIEKESERFGRYKNPRFLLDAFIPPQMSLEGDAKKEAEELKFRLQLSLLKQNLLTPEDPEAESAVLGFVERDEMLQACRGVLPLPVMSALVTVQMYQDITDQERLQTYMNNNARSLLSDYLRVTAVSRSHDGIDFEKLFVHLPDKIFQDSSIVAWQIVKDYFVTQAINLFRDDPTGIKAFPKLRTMATGEENEGKKRFLQDILSEFEEINAMEIPTAFNREVEGWDNVPSPFPLFRQKYFAHEFAKTHRKLLMGDTGATKTASSYLAMEYVGAKRVTIIGPAKARDTWPAQAEKHFAKDAGKVVFTVRGEKDLQNPLVITADYVFIGEELLALIQAKPEKRDELLRLLTNIRQTDGIIIDEAHTFKNESAQRSNMLAAIVNEADKKYSKTHPGGKPLPIIELNATPISNSIEDLDVLLGVLYPNRFAMPGTQSQTREVFSKYALRDPKLAYTLLFGEKLLIQWSSQDIFGSKIPELNPKREVTSLSHYERQIYEWVANAPTDPLQKINLLINVLLNPNLVKEICIKKGWAIPDIPTKEKLQQRFDELYLSWGKWYLSDRPTIPDEPFSADWIAKFLSTTSSDDFFLIQAFFSRELENGVFSLAKEKSDPLSEMFDTHFSKNWEFPEAASTKYGALKDHITERLLQHGDGLVPKFFVVSPFRRGAVTGNLTPEQEGMGDMESLYGQMNSWFPQMDIYRVDGTQDFKERADLANLWTSDNTTPTACVASMKAVFESGDWSVKHAENTREVDVIFLGWPWGWDDFKQMSGRFLRPGLATPVNIHVLETDDTIDLGFQELVKRKYLLTQMALFGVELSHDDQKFFDESLAAGRILASQRESQLFYVRETYRRLKGRGEVALNAELTRSVEPGKTNADRIAQFYYEGGLDEFRTVGFNAQHVTNIALERPIENALSIGAGTGLFARKMRASGFSGRIVNLDINAAKLNLAREKHPEILTNGENIVAAASDLEHAIPSDNLFDIVESSYMLDLTSLETSTGKASTPFESERVRIPLEMRRVAKVGGRILITLPYSSFKDGSDFTNFTNSLEQHFGMHILPQSGVAIASDGQSGEDRTYTKRLVWIIITETTEVEPSLNGLELSSLAFSTDPDVVIRERNGRRRNGKEIDLPEFKLVNPDFFEIMNPRDSSVHVTRSKKPQVSKFPPGMAKDRRDKTVSQSDANRLTEQINDIRLDLLTMKED